MTITSHLFIKFLLNVYCVPESLPYGAYFLLEKMVGRQVFTEQCDKALISSMLGEMGAQRGHLVYSRGTRKALQKKVNSNPSSYMGGTGWLRLKTQERLDVRRSIV